MSDNGDKLAGAIRARDAYVLARMADTYSPDSSTSPGTIWLKRVRDDLAERVEYESDSYPELSPAELAEHVRDGDIVHEVADGMVPIYNHDRMQVLVDLGAYLEDISDYGEPEDVLTAAGWSLYVVAERLAVTLLEEVAEELEDV